MKLRFPSLSLAQNLINKSMTAAPSVAAVSTAIAPLNGLIAPVVMTNPDGVIYGFPDLVSGIGYDSTITTQIRVPQYITEDLTIDESLYDGGAIALAANVHLNLYTGTLNLFIAGPSSSLEISNTHFNLYLQVPQIAIGDSATCYFNYCKIVGNVSVAGTLYLNAGTDTSQATITTTGSGKVIDNRAYLGLTPFAIQNAVLAGTWSNGELQGTQPAGSVAGMKFVTSNYCLEYQAVGAAEDYYFAWIRTAKG